jgi:murein DD-endopeptidase MepM/ murein hydrolase activator NlpD
VREWLRSPSWPRVVALALTAFGVAACSGDASRLNDNPIASRANADTTGTVTQPQAMPVARVESRPLPPQTAQVTPVSLGGARSGVAGGGKGMASYTPGLSNAAPAEATGTITPKPAPSGHWTWDGGTPVTVGPADTIETIARRYGVPASAIIKTNNLASAQSIRPGQQVVIPRFVQASHAVQASQAPTAPKTIAAATPASTAGVHVVAAGDTLSKVSRMYHKSAIEIAKANNIEVTARLNVGDRLIIPGMRNSAANANSSASVAENKPAPAAAQPEGPPSASVFKELPDGHDGKEATRAEGTGALPKFRWPANGRVITAFGPTTSGQQNDGINIAVPENTPVKAAEDGVVAYAGNELKGYGNLVLVRHPNGYVTAYAHTKELLVKRGDQVKRGQVIARSGQSGNVNAPQLHFEIRKGAAPLDPTKFLNGA